MAAARNQAHVKMSIAMRKAQRDEQAAIGESLLKSREAMIRERNEKIQAKRAAQREEQRLLKEKQRALAQQKARLRHEQQRVAQARTNQLVQKQRALEDKLLRHAKHQHEQRQEQWQRQQKQQSQAVGQRGPCWLRLHPLAPQQEEASGQSSAPLLPLQVFAPRATVGRSRSSGADVVVAKRVVGGVEPTLVSKLHCLLEQDGCSTETSAPLPQGGPGSGSSVQGRVLWITDTSRNGTFIQHAGETIRLRHGVRTAVVLPPPRPDTVPQKQAVAGFHNSSTTQETLLCLQLPSADTGCGVIAFRLELVLKDGGSGSSGNSNNAYLSTASSSSDTAAAGTLKPAAWEQHTKGIGSKLLAQMGYSGAGLGRHGDGIVEPIKVKATPEGAGLGFEAPAKRAKRSALETAAAIRAIHAAASMTSDERAQRAAVSAGADPVARAAAERKSRASDLFQLQSEIGHLRKQLRKLRGTPGLATEHHIDSIAAQLREAEKREADITGKLQDQDTSRKFKL
eukprot:INCI12935.1.p1 GENE.INCI12935.1~~INCI12935.1.p1  ORF type:complete len:529 (-),score=109.10 INCI12935.1:83-1615(-)